MTGYFFILSVIQLFLSENTQGVTMGYILGYDLILAIKKPDKIGLSSRG